jgi:hypothetical protein
MICKRRHRIGRQPRGDLPVLSFAPRGLEYSLTVRKLADPEIKVVVNGDFALAPIRRSGLRERKANGSALTGGRTAAMAEAVLWALLRIATGRNEAFPPLPGFAHRCGTHA